MNKTLEMIFKFGWKTLNVARDYPISLYGGFRNRKVFDDLTTYCMFIGYTCSGKTLVASLLDAHPNIIIAEEFGALKHVYAGFSRNQIFYLLLENSRAFTKTGRKSKGRSHLVPSQWQGRFNKLKIIGDNHGEGATMVFSRKAWLLHRLSKNMGLNTKFIHVIRNPYDNISSMSITKRRSKLKFKDSIDHYFSLCETITDIKKRINPNDMFELRHESFIENPAIHLKNLCHFLGAEAPDNYLKDCAGIVHNLPHKTRYEVRWHNELIEMVKVKIAQFPFLKGYSYED